MSSIPASADELMRRASALQRAGRVEEAIAAYEQLLGLRPDLPDSWYNLGWLRRQARRFEPALAAYDEALRRGARGPEEIHLNRAVILADHLGRPEAAEAELEQALALNPAYAPAWLNLGNLHEDHGRREAAREAYARALDAAPGGPLALARLAGVSRIAGPDDPIVGRLRAAIAAPGAGAADRADLGFALGRALDEAGAYDEAFAAYADANAASRASFGGIGYDRAAHAQAIDRLIAAFPGAGAAAADCGDAPPVFICGLFRSGSTLAERILSGHSRVTAGGELDLLPALIAAELRPYPEAVAALGPDGTTRLARLYLDGVDRIHPGARDARRLVTDKRPDNFLHVGLIKRMFPTARIVHTVRAPLDNILSLHFLHLGPEMAYAFDLDDSAHWYRQYRRLMAHWKMLWPQDIFDLDYDKLVAEPRATLSPLLDFLGLPWEDAVLDFPAAGGVVKTASVWQVREPLYRRSSGRWRHYARQLEAVRGELGEFAPDEAARG